MATKIRFVITLIISLAIYKPAWPQISDRTPISMDSAITLATNMLNSGMKAESKNAIDSLLNLVADPSLKSTLELQLKIRSLQGRFILTLSKYEDFQPLYDWCKEQVGFCRTEEEFNMMARLFNNGGIAFKNLKRFSDSEEAYLKSSELLRKLKMPDYYLFGVVYANAGNALRSSGEFDRAIEYLNQSIGYFNDYVDKSDNPRALATIANPKSKAMESLGLVYQSLADHQKAIDIFQSCIDFKLLYYPPLITDDYNNIAISLIEVGRFNEAKHYVELIIKEFSDEASRDHSWALAKLNLADINFRMSADTAAFISDLNSLNKAIRNKIPSTQEVSVVADQMIANILLVQSKHEAALQKWSEAITTISTGTRIFSPGEIPYSITTLYFNKLIELMNFNSKIFFDWGNRTGDIEKLKESEKRYSFTLTLIDSLRNRLELQSSKLQVSKMQRTTYNQLIQLDYSLFQLTGDSLYISNLFTAMEQSKSAGLWSSVKDIEFKNSLIPAEDLLKEDAIRKKISDLQGKMIEAGAGGDAEPGQIRLLQEENLFYNQQIDSLKQYYRQKYPDYYKAKFDHSTITLTEVRKRLTPGQVLIEFAMAYDYVYILSASPTSTVLNRVALSTELIDDIEFLPKFMQGDLESLTSEAKASYCTAATNLYEKLLGLSIAELNSSELLIIPDGSLSYIPFEALLEPSEKTTSQDYRKLPYLIRNHSVSYGLTATLLYYQSQRIANPTRRLLAIAPQYKFNSGNISDFVRKSKSGLPELKGTNKESQEIKKLMGGRLLTGSHATESKFKTIAQKYSILHLAMHSIPDNANSLNSCLVFTPGADHKEDGVLFGHEIYNLSLNSWLTVLSACETGSGQMASGEGVLSFGRAFIGAGCPSLVMTLWTVDDRSSQKIMVQFYQSMLSGAGIGTALQKSKLEYLANVDQLHAHPHFWAGFVELGQNQVLKIPQRKPAFIYLILFITGTVLVLVWFQAKKNPRRSRDIMETE